jgi:L-2-hydroxyglutarate oxidase
MARQVRQFIPGLDTSYITGKGLSGVRNSLIDSRGFVPEAVLEHSDHSVHILNYNSPGATGAPAFAMHVIRLLKESGKISLKETDTLRTSIWKAEVEALL